MKTILRVWWFLLDSHLPRSGLMSYSYFLPPRTSRHWPALIKTLLRFNPRLASLPVRLQKLSLLTPPRLQRHRADMRTQNETNVLRVSLKSQTIFHS